jgi:uncharacterized protein YndB with AHSA1/START domain
MPEHVDWSEAKCAHYEFALEINASAARVWRAITDQVGSWWLPHFHMLGESSTVELEPHAGGRLLEREGSRELLWYTVIAIDPERSIDLAGYCTAKYGGPATTLLSLAVSPLATQRCRLQVSDSLFGRVSPEFVRSLHSGWQELFGSGLRLYVEANGH